MHHHLTQQTADSLVRLLFASLGVAAGAALPAALHVGLLDAVGVELTSAGYARVNAGGSAWSVVVVPRTVTAEGQKPAEVVVSNDAQLAFGAAGADWVYSGVGLWNAATDGDLVLWTMYPTPRLLQSGQPLVFEAEQAQFGLQFGVPADYPSL